MLGQERKVSMELKIDIVPKGQMRPKVASRGGFPRVYEDPVMKQWRQQATMDIKKKCKGNKPFDKNIPLKVDMVFFMPAPASIAKEPTPRAKPDTWMNYERFLAELIPVPKKPDLDNLEKAIYDSISDSKLIWHDDNQIVEHRVRKFYSPNPRIELVIEEYVD